MKSVLLLLVMSGCVSFSNVEKDCSRVVTAVNDRAVACQAPWVLVMDCSAGVDTGGDVDACLTAVASCSCEDLRGVVTDRCALFNGW